MKGNQFTVWNINIYYHVQEVISVYISRHSSTVITVLCIQNLVVAWVKKQMTKMFWKCCFFFKLRRAGFKWQRLFWIPALVRLELSFIFNNTRSSTASVTLQLSSLRLGWDQLDDPLYGPHLTPNIWDTQLSSSSPKFTKYLDYIIICK